MYIFNRFIHFIYTKKQKIQSLQRGKQTKENRNDIHFSYYYCIFSFLNEFVFLNDNLHAWDSM